MAFISDEQSKALEEVGKRLVEAIRRRLAEENVNASGSLSDSLEYRTTDTGLQIWANDYFKYAENGRPAGKVPYDFATILERWVEAKGINVPAKFKDAHQFGWAIATKIKNYGSLRHRTNTQVDLLDEPINEVLDEVTEILTKVFLQTVNDNL